MVGNSSLSYPMPYTDACAGMARLRCLCLEGCLLDVGEDWVAMLQCLVAGDRCVAPGGGGHVWVWVHSCEQLGIRLHLMPCPTHPTHPGLNIWSAAHVVHAHARTCTHAHIADAPAHACSHCRRNCNWMAWALGRSAHLQLVASMCRAMLVGVLQHMPRWPEVLITMLLALWLFWLLGACAAATAAALLMGLGPVAQLHARLQPLRQLRVLSLRRCTFTQRRRRGSGSSSSLVALLCCMPDLRYLDCMWLNVEAPELVAAAQLPHLHYLCASKQQLGSPWRQQLEGANCTVVEPLSALESVLEQQVFGPQGVEW